MFVDVKNVSHAYSKNSKKCLVDINFSIQEKEHIAIVGPSGCGKSTLLHIIAGLIKPLSGEISVNNCAVTKPTSKINMMFQEPSLYPWMTVEQNIETGLKFSGNRDYTSSRIQEVLELVDLSTFAKRNVQDLSGGQKQRVALARSLAVNPYLLLLDEPFSGLDVMIRAHLQKQISSIVKGLGVNLIIVTHNIETAIAMGDKIFVMKEGNLVEKITPKPSLKDNQDDVEFKNIKEKIMNVFQSDSDIKG